MHNTNRFARMIAIIVIATFILPLSVPFGVTSVAHAQGESAADGGGLFGNLLGGLFENPEMLMMMLTMLMSLFQGGMGGNTAEGPVEEQPSRPATGSERFGSGPRGSTGESSDDSTGSSNYTKERSEDITTMKESESLYISDGTIYPTSVQISKDSTVTVYNTDDSPHMVHIKEGESATSLASRSIVPENAHLFRFGRTSTYEVCLGQLTEALCPATITVQE